CAAATVSGVLRPLRRSGCPGRSSTTRPLRATRPFRAVMTATDRPARQGGQLRGSVARRYERTLATQPLLSATPPRSGERGLVEHRPQLDRWLPAEKLLPRTAHLHEPRPSSVSRGGHPGGLHDDRRACSPRSGVARAASCAW